MPKVGDKDFEYDEEGVAAAEAEAARTGQEIEAGDEETLDEVLSDLPAEDAPVEEESAEEPVEGDVEASDEEIAILITELFASVFGEDFNPEDPDSIARMEELMGMLEANPEMGEALARGEITPAELAIRFYREMGGEEPPAPMPEMEPSPDQIPLAD